jgi:putative ABC transport system permease protein
MPRLLPWEYGVRNLLRRPTRSLLTLLALTLVILLVLVVIGFLRGLETSLAVSGDPRVVYIHSLGSSEHLENSSVPGNTADVVKSSLRAIQRRGGLGREEAYVSPELYLGTQIVQNGSEPSLGLVRGVTESAQLVRRQMQIVEGHWPKTGEVLVGRLAAAKLSLSPEDLAVGKTIAFEEKTWRISGRFSAAGSGLEAEIWCLLDDLQPALKRQDLSYVAVTLAPGASFGDVDEFCKTRTDLELEATAETDYYQILSKHYGPVRVLAWLVVVLVAGAGIFAGLNAMYGAVVGRVRELATLQTIGFSRRAIALALMQEALLLATLACLAASLLAVLVLHGLAIRFTMGAFTLRIDGVTLLWGYGIGLGLGVLGALPPAIRAMRLPVAEGLKAM